MKRIIVLICIILTAMFAISSCAEPIHRENLFERDTASAVGIGTGSSLNEHQTSGGIGKLEGETTSGGISQIGDNLSDDVLTVDVPSTGKSDCILVRCGGKSLLIDTGESNNRSVIFDMLDSLGIKNLDYMIITHYDNDHIGCAADILQKYAVGKVLMPNYVRISGDYNALMSAVGNADSKKITENVVFSLGKAEVTVNPTHLYDDLGEVVIDRDDDATLDAEENNFSLITRITFKDSALLFLGDAEKERVNEFISVCDADTADSLDLKCEFIKLPHHGSYDSALGKLIARSGAFYGLVCTSSRAMIDNGLELAMSKSIMYKTYDGAITITTDGSKYKFQQ